jgi:hypothetical protein
MGAFFQTVSGRKDCGFGHEHNDCTVRALARAGQITYAQADAIGEAAGRKNAAGSASKRSSNAPRRRPTEGCLSAGACGSAPSPGATPTGRYVVHTHRHVAAVVDGALCDAIECSRCLVTRAWNFV